MLHVNPHADLFGSAFRSDTPAMDLARALVRTVMDRCTQCGRTLEDPKAITCNDDGPCELFWARWVLCPLCDTRHKLESPGVRPDTRPVNALGDVLEPCPDCSPRQEGERDA